MKIEPDDGSEYGYVKISKKTKKRIEEMHENIIDEYCELISKLDVKIVNVVVIKNKIIGEENTVLKKAFTYSIQRIHNDMEKNFSNENFMIITDKGRVASMIKISRKMIEENSIPSKFSGKPYEKTIELLIEDPLGRDSKQSYFVQTVDMIAYIVYLYIHKSIPKRMPNIVNDKIEDWMNTLKSSLNTDASENCKYGIVRIPREW